MKVQIDICTQPPTLGTVTTKEQHINNPKCTVDCIQPKTICVPPYPARTPLINTRDYISESVHNVCTKEEAKEAMA